MQLSDSIKQTRISHAMTQAKLADFLGVTTRSIQFYESGERSPTIETIIKLADYFDVSIDYLTGRVDDPKQHLK